MLFKHQNYTTINHLHTFLEQGLDLNFTTRKTTSIDAKRIPFTLINNGPRTYHHQTKTPFSPNIKVQHIIYEYIANPFSIAINDSTDIKPEKGPMGIHSVFTRKSNNFNHIFRQHHKKHPLKLGINKLHHKITFDILDPSNKKIIHKFTFTQNNEILIKPKKSDIITFQSNPTHLKQILDNLSINEITNQNFNTNIFYNFNNNKIQTSLSYDVYALYPDNTIIYCEFLTYNHNKPIIGTNGPLQLSEKI